MSSAPHPPPARYPAGRIAAWQAAASILVAGVGGWWAGWHGFLSGLLGGLVNVAAGIVFAMLVGLGRAGSAAATLRTMIRAEAAKITLIVLLLWLALGGYGDVVPGIFFAAFVATLVVSQAAILIRD